jgi:class 3 adenylate cyclase
VNTMQPSQNNQKNGEVPHEELVVAYHALHKVYTYIAHCDPDVVAVNLYSVRRSGEMIGLKRLAQTGRGADYALPEESAGIKKGESAAGLAARHSRQVGFYIPLIDNDPTIAFALNPDTKPAQDEHLKNSYDCPLFLLAEGFKSEEGKEYSIVLIARCQTNDLRGYWLSSTEASETGVPLLPQARAHLANVRQYLQWALTHSANHNSISHIRAWNRLPVVSVKNKQSLLQTLNLVTQAQRDQIKYAAVLFADIRGFTDLTTKITQHESAILANFLNFLSSSEAPVSEYRISYFEAAHKVISAHGGQLDKFMGDGVMGTFFNSDNKDDHVHYKLDTGVYEEMARQKGISSPPALKEGKSAITNASQLAREKRNYLGTVREQLTAFNLSVDSLAQAVRSGIALTTLFHLFWFNAWRKRVSAGHDGKPIPDIEAATENVSLGVGICGGPLVAGYFGSRWHDQFTVLGDTVNRAQRMESRAVKDKSLFSSGKDRGPSIVVHVPVSTLFAGVVEYDKKMAELFRDNLKKKLSQMIPDGTYKPLQGMEQFFLEDEERELTERFGDYAVKVTSHAHLVTTKKDTNEPTSEATEPAVGFYVEALEHDGRGS